MQAGTGLSDESDGARRRDFVDIAAVSFGAVGAGAVLLRSINQMNRSGDVLAVAAVEVGSITLFSSGDGLEQQNSRTNLLTVFND